MLASSFRSLSSVGGQWCLPQLTTASRAASNIMDSSRLEGSFVASSSKKMLRQENVARRHIAQYTQAKMRGDMNQALRLLDKASHLSEYVFVQKPNDAGGKDLIPLSALVPRFRYDESELPRVLLPVAIHPSFGDVLADEARPESVAP